MVQRKYIIIHSSKVRFVSLKVPYLPKILLFLIIILKSTISYSSAWLPGEKGYKISSSILLIDPESMSLQKERAKSLLSAYRIMNKLLQKDNLSKAEKRDLKMLEDFCNKFDAFNDDFFVNSEIEYGINKRESFGLKANLAGENRFQYKANIKKPDDHGFKKTIAREIGFYYKNLLYKNDKWQITLVPEINYKKKHRFIKQHKINWQKSINIGSYVGYTKILKSGKKTFSQLGFIIGKISNYKASDTIFKKISFLEGLEMKKGFFLNNYLEYSFASNGNILYNHVAYDQVAIAKEISISDRNQQTFTAQIGYYWKNSLVNSEFKVSGPIFSLWMNL